MLDEVKARRKKWSVDQELLALIADRVGVSASGKQYKDDLPRIRRPHEPDPNAPLSWGGFARKMMGG